jgi:hypothetical protein
VLFFTGNRAGVTADATILIDDKSVAHFIPFESTVIVTLITAVKRGVNRLRQSLRPNAATIGSKDTSCSLAPCGRELE